MLFNAFLSHAQGGKFHHGFLSGEVYAERKALQVIIKRYTLAVENSSSRSISSLGGSYLMKNGGNMSGAQRIAISAAIGGTAEALGGGKFANGAVTGAYVMALNHMGQLRNKSLYDEGKTSFTIRKLAFFVPDIGDPLFGFLGVKYKGLINVDYCDITGNYILELAITGTAYTTEDFSPNLILRTELIENGNIIQTNSSAGHMPSSAITSGASTHKNLGLAAGRIPLPEFSQNLSLKITVGFNYGTANGNWVYPNAFYIHNINQTRAPHYLNPK